MIVHRFGFFDFKSFWMHRFIILSMPLVLIFRLFLGVSLCGLCFACNPTSTKEENKAKQADPQSRSENLAPNSIHVSNSGSTKPLSGAKSSVTVGTSGDVVTPEDKDDEDVSDLIVEQYMNTRLHLSQKTCQVTAFDTQTPDQVQWTWQLNAAPGRCDFARDPNGVLRAVKTDKGDVIFVVSSSPESTTSKWCRTKISAFVYSLADRNGPWSISVEAKKTQDCAPKQWYKKMFQIMAQRTRPLQ